MKELLVCSLFVLCGSNFAFARLGETPARIEKVLGKPYRNAWDVQRWYKKKPYQVYIQFENVNGRLMSVLEVWSRLDGKQMSTDEQRKLLVANVDLSRADQNNPPMGKYDDGWKSFVITTRRWMGLSAYRKS